MIRYAVGDEGHQSIGSPQRGHRSGKTCGLCAGKRGRGARHPGRVLVARGRPLAPPASRSGLVSPPANIRQTATYPTSHSICRSGGREQFDEAQGEISEILGGRVRLVFVGIECFPDDYACAQRACLVASVRRGRPCAKIAWNVDAVRDRLGHNCDDAIFMIKAQARYEVAGHQSHSPAQGTLPGRPRDGQRCIGDRAQTKITQRTESAGGYRGLLAVASVLLRSSGAPSQR